MTTLQIVVGSISGILLIIILYGIFKELSEEEGVEVFDSGPSPVPADIPGKTGRQKKPRGRPRKKSRRS